MQQGICRLSRRWHQQFCHSPSFGPHQQCFQVLGPSRGLRQARGQVRASRNDSETTKSVSRPSASTRHDLSPAALLRGAGDGMVVREFEQHGSDASTLRPIEPDAALSNEVNSVWQEIRDIDRELAVLRQGPFGPQSEFMQQFSPEDREKILSELAKEGYVPEEEEDLLDLAEIDRLLEEEKEESSNSESFAVELATSAGHQALTKYFNKVLLEAAKDEENQIKSLRLWKWYIQCQERIPGFLRNIPPSVWKFLWSSQLRLKQKPQHLVKLGQDMLDSQIEMEIQIWLQYIEALVSCARLEEARTIWEDIKADPEIEEEKEFLLEFYTIGIRIYGSLDQPAQAQSLAFSAIQKGAQPTVLVQSIVAWANSGAANSAAKAWTVYLKLLKLMGKRMKPSIYQEISDALLQSGKRDMACTIFKDLIQSIRSPQSNVLTAYEKALGNADLNEDPQELEDAINKVSLTMLLALPSGYKNKFFFSPWLKHLIGVKRTDAAAKVVDLMYEREIRPDAIHLNGLLGAWLRDNSPEACQRAEVLANEMIQAKVNQVAATAREQAQQNPLNLFRKVFFLDKNGRVAQPSVQQNRFLPPANHETFALMLDYYEKKRRWRDFNDLTQTFFGPAQLSANIFIANKLLSVELRNRALGRFWAIYEDLANKLEPNLETFGLVWQATALQAGTGKNFLNTIGRAPEQEYHVVDTDHRQHFASLMDWMKRSSGRSRATALQDLNEVFYGEVTKSFLHSLDLPGMICVMRGLYQMFDFAPPDAAIQLILVSVARALPRSEATPSIGGGRRRVKKAELGVDQTKLKKIATIVDTVEAELKLERERNGVASEKFEDRDSAEFKRLRVDVMTEFLMLMMQHITKQNPLTIHESVTAAAKVMHVALGKRQLSRTQLRMQEL